MLIILSYESPLDAINLNFVRLIARLSRLGQDLPFDVGFLHDAIGDFMLPLSILFKEGFHHGPTIGHIQRVAFTGINCGTDQQLYHSFDSNLEHARVLYPLYELCS